MPDDAPETTVKLAPSIQAVPAAEWDACAGSGNPFVSHAFLEALEESGSVGAGTGWRPAHLLLEDAGGRLLGCRDQRAGEGGAYGGRVGARP